ncbi:MAG TPA: hypothetical protein VN610_00145 [Bryobacteraceae bacterium]|nr:hypothetical protein [Bryobacteraceae bacterium]
MPPDARRCGVQERDAEFLNKRRMRRRPIDPTQNGEPVEPLYTTEDAERVFPLSIPCRCGC